MEFLAKPIVIAGPCAAESFELMSEVAVKMLHLSQQLGFDLFFKASFDKANRTSLTSNRGVGLRTCLKWFQDLKDKYHLKILTDVHETHQIHSVAEVCDVLQIPAFLCRQTDLVTQAATTGKIVNIKKGQFLAPGAMASIVQKAQAAQDPSSTHHAVWVTERGACFGYGNLVVDMRAFPIMAQSRVPLILDITHSTQLPAVGGETVSVTGGERQFAPVLARAATATGYLSGYFLEVHSNPAKAISDKDVQLNLTQAEKLLNQLIPSWQESKNFHKIDRDFII